MSSEYYESEYASKTYLLIQQTVSGQLFCAENAAPDPEA